MTGTRIAVLYSAFAAISILVNIGTQVMFMAAYSGTWAIYLSIVVGTATGLVAKYLLDKRWIFAHVSRDRSHEARTFMLYAVMGLLTTAVFWGAELGFHLLFSGDAMRYLGGGLGLIAGYVMKYRLDKRFVFVNGL